MEETFDVERFERRLPSTWLGSEFIYIEKFGSTNSYLKKVPSSDLVHGTVALADHQTGGRGQYQRKWQSEPYKNLTFTVAFKPPGSARLNLLTLSAGYALCSALEDTLERPVRMKWPNDLITGGKKISGLLTEAVFNGQKPNRVLIGIGINVNQTNFEGTLENRATSLRLEKGRTISREDLLCDVLVEMEQAYRRWQRQDETLRMEICRNMIGFGEWVGIEVNGNRPEGKFKFIGIGPEGELLMLNEELDVNTFRYEQVRIIAGNKRISETDRDPSA